MDPYSTQMILLNQLGRMSSLFVEHIVSIIWAVVLLFVGLIVSEVVQRVGAALLGRFGWNKLCTRMGVVRTLQKVKADVSPAIMTGRVLYWLVLLSFFMQALIVSNLNSISWIGRAYFDHFGMYTYALVCMFVAVVISHWTAKWVLLSITTPAAWLASGITRVLILCLGTQTALQSVGWERELVMPLVLILFGSSTLALALFWALSRGQGYLQVVRVEEYEEGVIGS